MDNPAAQIDAETVMRVHRATGLRVMKARRYVSELSEHHRRQLLAAIEQQTGPEHYYLHDPIEDDPTVGPLIAQVRDEIEQSLIAKGECQPGRGALRIWSDTQRALREKHGIEWLTPQQLNPEIGF